MDWWSSMPGDKNVVGGPSTLLSPRICLNHAVIKKYKLWHTATVQVLINHHYYLIRRRQWHPTPVLLPGKSHGRRSPVGCSPWVAKSWMRLSDFTFTFHLHALEKEMAPHSSVLAWRIPGTGEPGGLLSLGSHRFGHN